MTLLPRLFHGYRGNFPAAPVESAPMHAGNDNLTFDLSPSCGWHSRFAVHCFHSVHCLEADIILCRGHAFIVFQSDAWSTSLPVQRESSVLVLLFWSLPFIVLYTTKPAYSSLPDCIFQLILPLLF